MKRIVAWSGGCALIALVGLCIMQPWVHVGEGFPDTTYRGALDATVEPTVTGVRVTAFAPIGYEAMLFGGELYAWQFFAEYSQDGEGNLQRQTATSMPVVVTRNDEVQRIEEPTDARYARDIVRMFPRKVRHAFDETEEHNTLVERAELQAEQAARAYFTEQE